MRKFTNVNLSDLFAFLEKYITKERVEYLKESISESSFEKSIHNGRELKNLVVHVPTDAVYMLHDVYENGERRQQKPTDNLYNLQTILEKLMTPEENALATKWEDDFSREDLRNKYEEKLLKKSKRVSYKDWNDPVFYDEEYATCIDSAIENILDNIEEDPEDISFEDFCSYFPKFFSCSSFRPVISKWNVKDLFERDFEENDDGDYEVGNQLKGWEDLQRAFDKFYEKNKNIGLFWEDSSKIIILDEEFLKKNYEGFKN